MTSIISPAMAATKLASTAQAHLAQASSTLRHQAPGRPTEPQQELRIGIPEQTGPDSPDNPWFVGRRPIMAPELAARASAIAAVADIDKALALGTMLTAGTVTAFTRAKDEALAGANMLHSPTDLPVRPGQAALTFDAAGLWLGLAKNLIALNSNTLPAPQPVIEPITIQLPDPSAPIQ